MAGATLKVLSAGAVKSGVALVAAQFERASGTPVTVEFDTAPQVGKRIGGGEHADVIVAPPLAMDGLAKQGKIDAGSRGFIGRSRMGVVVHADAPAVELADVASLTRLLADATAVVHNQASSGIYAAKLVEKLGLTGELRERIVVVPSGSAVMEGVAERPPGAVGLAQISEIMVMIDKGCRVKLAAPLPAEVQNETSYDAAAASGASPAAVELARHLASAEAKKVFAGTGIS